MRLHYPLHIFCGQLHAFAEHMASANLSGDLSNSSLRASNIFGNFARKVISRKNVSQAAHLVRLSADGWK